MVPGGRPCLCGRSGELTTPRPRATENLTPPIAREPAESGASHGSGDISALSILSILLRHRVLILGIALLTGFQAGLQSITSPRYFTASAEFMPQGMKQGQLSGLAQQFGISLGGGDAGQSPAFYMDLLESRSLLSAVGNRTYTLRTPKGVATGNIVKVYRIKGNSPAIQKAGMIDVLKGAIEEETAPRTGVIILKVHAPTAEMALQLARSILDEINLFNLNRRQAQAGAERSFIEKRLGEAQLELRQAEENLQSFLTENREFRSSPSLQLEFDRLNRAVAMRQQLFNSLAQSYEQAKIEEVRDLPVITVVEPPELPIEPDARGGVRKTMIGIAVGLVFGMLLAFASHLLEAHRDAHTDDFARFSALKSETLDDLRHPWRIFTRLLSRPKPS